MLRLAVRRHLPPRVGSSFLLRYGTEHAKQSYILDVVECLCLAIQIRTRFIPGRSLPLPLGRRLASFNRDGPSVKQNFAPLRGVVRPEREELGFDEQRWCLRHHLLVIANSNHNQQGRGVSSALCAENRGHRAHASFFVIGPRPFEAAPPRSDWRNLELR